MTSPGGHGSNDINLAALWVPVMPETSHMGEEMRKAGAESKRQFEQGFNSGASPEAMGSNFSNSLMSSITRGMRGVEMPFLGDAHKKLEQFGVDVDSKMVNKLKNEATTALRNYSGEYSKLQALQTRSVQLEEDLNNRRAAGLSASGIIPAMQAHQQVQKELNAQVQTTSASYETYTGKLSSLKGAQGEVAASGEVLAGIMGGLVVAGVQMVGEAVTELATKLVEGAVEGFKMAVEAGKKFAETMLEIGESYEHIGIQVTEFSGATGEQLEELEAHAQGVFNTLDVAGKNVGQTMAQFSAILDAEPSVALDTLTKHVTELQGRFTSLKTTDLASIFYAFKTPLSETDTALASLLQSARNSGQDIGQLTSALSGEGALTLQQAGLNLQQAGAFMGELLKLGPSGRSVMTGLSAAMKDFDEEGLSFSDGMKLAGERLKELGDTAEGQDIAEKLFGTRRWVVAMAAVQQYVDVVEKGPQAFNSSSSALDEFLDKTETLEMKWEEVKHKFEAAFAPMGMAAMKIVGEGLDNVLGFVRNHMDQIHVAMTRGGVYIIEFAKTAQGLAVGLLEFFGPVINAIDSLMGNALNAFGTFTQGIGEVLALIPGMHDIGVGMIDAGKSTQEFGNKLRDINVGDKMDKLAQWIKQHPIDVQDAAESWVGFSDHVADSMQKSLDAVYGANQGIGALGTAGILGAGGIGAPTGLPGGGSGPPVPPGIAGSPGNATPGGGIFAGGAAAGDVKGLARQLFPWGEDQWQAFVTLEEAEAGWDPTARNPSSGAFGLGQFLGHEKDQYASGYSTDPAMQLKTMFKYIADRYGTPSAAWSQYYQHPGGQGYYEYGGVIGQGANLYDSNRPTGGSNFNPDMVIDTSMATVAPPFDRNRLRFGDILGMTKNNAGMTGGLKGMHGENPYSREGGPRGTDTIPAWLTPGEYVWDTKTVDQYGWLISMLHKGKGFEGGGGTGSSDYVANGGGNDLAGVDAQIAFVQQIAQGFGLTLTAGKSGHGTHSMDGGYHDTGEAGDFSNGMQTDQELAFAMYMIEHYGSQLAEVIHTDPRLPKLIKDGNLVDPQAVYGPWLPGHKDHVHIAIKASQAMTDLSPGNETLAGGLPPMPTVGGAGSIPGGKTGASFPGMAGQYGGNGVYGGQTTDQMVQAQQNIQDAQDRASDMDYTIQQNQRRIDDLKEQIAQVGVSDKTGLLTGQPVKRTPEEMKQDDEKRKQLNEQLDDATHQLSVSQRERAQQDGKITEAQRKAQESALRKPTGSTTQSAAGKAGQSLGGGLLEGIGQELGLGDVFGKSPLDWGIVKLFTGLFNYANGLGDAIFGATNGAQGGGLTAPTGGGLGAGLLAGVTSSAGINLPTAATVSAGPNVIPVQPGSPFGVNGPAPGPPPVIAGDYMPIHVQAGVDPKAVLGPVQEQRNAQNSRTFTHTGGLPAS